ncbi:tolloid-like protein 2 [Branchiostoma floridae]|uniref:Tolloid-like protein 2 n=1 Tax=Branchiostoma floridae TaxID=7739 RepID=A0A9J7K975_BRAFL|nr:tolloid-like protein 2 [Branchiostoma floridae]
MLWSLKVLLLTTSVWRNIPGHAQEHGECGGYVTRQSSGYIDSPNYPGQYGNNMFCTWTIEVALGEVVKLTPVAFSLEDLYDWIAVYDDATLLGEYSALTVNLTSALCPDPGVPHNGYRQGDSVTAGAVVSFGCHEGFILTGQEHITCMSGDRRDWTARPPTCEDSACSTGRYVYGQDGEIASPRDLTRGTYPTNVDCTWQISVDPGEVVVLEFLEFNIEYQPRCLYDWFQIHDLTYISFYQLFCGFLNSTVYVSMASTLALHFHSDGEIATTGFRIRYHVQNRSADDQKGYQRVHLLSEDAGSFSSMNFPWSPYSNNVYQQWDITVDVHKHVKLMFTEFDVAETQYCLGDQVVIDDPYGSTRAAICGTCLPMPRVSKGNSLVVVFMTDFVIRRDGFSARYEAVGDRSEPSAQDALQPDWLWISDVRIKQISVSSSTNQVWALDESGRPLRRTGITAAVPQDAAAAR